MKLKMILFLVCGLLTHQSVCGSDKRRKNDEKSTPIVNYYLGAGNQKIRGNHFISDICTLLLMDEINQYASDDLEILFDEGFEKTVFDCEIIENSQHYFINFHVLFQLMRLESFTLLDKIFDYSFDATEETFVRLLCCNVPGAFEWFYNSVLHKHLLDLMYFHDIVIDDEMYLKFFNAYDKVVKEEPLNAQKQKNLLKSLVYLLKKQLPMSRACKSKVVMCFSSMIQRFIN